VTDEQVRFLLDQIQARIQAVNDELEVVKDRLRDPVDTAQRGDLRVRLGQCGGSLAAVLRNILTTHSAIDPQETRED